MYTWEKQKEGQEIGKKEYREHRGIHICELNNGQRNEWGLCTGKGSELV